MRPMRQEIKTSCLKRLKRIEGQIRGLAGMVAINEVMGYRYRYYDGFSDNYGFTGIAVALLGRNHPVGVIFAALLFAMLQHGGIYVDGFSEHVTKDIVQVLQGIIILFVAAESFFKWLAIRIRPLRRLSATK